MSTSFTEDGEALPVTLVEAGPCMVTQIKSQDKERYQAVQIGYGTKKKLNKPLKGHLKDLGDWRFLREFRVDKTEDFKKGQKIEIGQFKPGDLLRITGIAKGKGFQGVVKRYGFKGSPATHGHKDQLRMPGSIGATGPQKVFKGTRLPGRMGGHQATIKNLEVLEVDPEKSIMTIKGAIPGSRNGLLLMLKTGARPQKAKPEKEEVKKEKKDKEVKK